MIMTCTLGKRTFTVDTAAPTEISIQQHFDENQPQFFGAEKASSQAVEGDGFIGDTARGGSCNVREIKLVPHCNGTHTESVAHICHDAPSVAEVLTDALIPATLITVQAEPAGKCNESYQPHPRANDRLITASSLQQQLKNCDEAFLSALLIRTLSNEPQKQFRNYDNEAVPYFSSEAMSYISQLPVKHLVVDLPSVDRPDDGGELSNHRLYWQVAAGSHQLSPTSRSDRTISEFAFIRDDIADGPYLAGIQIPPFQNDAAPSRIFIYNPENAD